MAVPLERGLTVYGVKAINYSVSHLIANQRHIFSRVLREFIPRFVGWLVGPHFTFRRF